MYYLMFSNLLSIKSTNLIFNPCSNRWTYNHYRR